MKVYKSVGDGVRPLRLFVGGVHGRECRTTKPIFEKLVKLRGPRRGSAVVVPCLYMGRYISTLDPGYLNSKAGRRLIRLVERLRPDIYVELHCYKPSSYQNLVSPCRFVLKGVPPLVELEQGVLIGLISPVLMSKLKLKTPIIVETPCGRLDNLKVAVRVLKTFIDTHSVQEALDELKEKYPEQMGRVLRLYGKWIFS
ncbi:DUF2119 domain-containing protein [Candidatus Bathyarchaeota archaeon]|nr:MAG: DUF2119 domain-containing protein [Candidatus Bathyarchaeota archaeon]